MSSPLDEGGQHISDSSTSGHAHKIPCTGEKYDLVTLFDKNSLLHHTE